MQNKLPQHIVNAIRRRARAAEQWNRADDQITAYCEQLGLDTEFVQRNVESLFRYFDPEFFIRDLEECLYKKHKKELKNEEDKLKKAIQQDGVNTQSHILDELKRRYPQYVKEFTNSDISHKKE